MKIELLFAFLQNFSCLAILLAVFCLIAGILYFIVIDEIGNEVAEKKAKKVQGRLFIGMFVFGLIATIPSPDQMWKVRIALIKLQLSSPENIVKSEETIERIGKKLECKYLGCDEKKK